MGRPCAARRNRPKAFVKELLGRTPGQFGDNIVRERFNDLIRKTYDGRERSSTWRGTSPVRRRSERREVTGRNGADGGVHRHCQDEQVDKTKAAQLIVIRIHEVDEPAPEKSRLRTF